MQPLLPLTAFAIACCITPGPNNMMLTASGANFGFGRTIPHILGITFGLLMMFVVAIAGLGSLFRLYPRMQTVMKVCGIIYLFYLSWKIARAYPAAESERTGKPLSFMQAAAFQFMNPKVLLMPLTALSTFTLSGQQYLLSAAVVTGIFLLVCLPSISIWAAFGTVIGRVLKNPGTIRIFNLGMGGLTAGCAIMLL